MIRSDLVSLRGGPIVTADAIALALALEARGHGMTAANGALRVSNGSALSADDRAAITRQRMHLLAIAAYQPPEAR